MVPPEAKDGQSDLAGKPPRSHQLLSLFLIFSLGIALYLPAINWGLPARTSWSQDTIAGVRTLGAVEEWPSRWHGIYPPLHYLLLRAAYEPILRHWSHSGGLTVNPETGQTELSEPQTARTGTLFLVAGLLSAIMAVGTGLVLYAAARRLTDDDPSAVAAAVALMIGGDFTYFAHLGNVDVPSVFWFACSVYFYLRLCHKVTLRDSVLLGLCGSLAMSTKDAVAGAYPGMAAALLALEIRRRPPGHSFPRKILESLCRREWLAGLFTFILPYLLLNGIPWNLHDYRTRMRFGLAISSDVVFTQHHRYSNPAELLGATILHAASSVGWPMLAAMLVAVLYTLRRRRRTAFLILAPAVSYLFIVLGATRFVYARFLLPVFALVAILVGITADDLWKRKLYSTWMRNLIVFMVLIPSLAYAMAVNAEMLTDSRYDAETWFLENVPPPADVGAFCKPQYLPRLHELGYATFLVTMKPESFDRPQPEYLVLTSFDYESYDETQRVCMNELLSERLGYREVARFQHRYLGAGSSYLSLAGWFTPSLGKISPTLIILRRTPT